MPVLLLCTNAAAVGEKRNKKKFFRWKLFKHLRMLQCDTVCQEHLVKKLPLIHEDPAHCFADVGDWKFLHCLSNKKMFK